MAVRPFSCQPGDAGWSALGEHPTATFISVAFHGGRVYYMDARRLVFVYDLNRGTRNAGAMVERCWRCDPFSYYGHGGAHLVTCAGELLLVARRRSPVPRMGGPQISSCCSSSCSSFAVVFKLDWTRAEPELGEMVTDLGEHSLFPEHGESFALSAKEFPGIKRNHVYCVAPEWNLSQT